MIGCQKIILMDDAEIPVLAEPMIAESTLGRRKTA